MANDDGYESQHAGIVTYQYARIKVPRVMRPPRGLLRDEVYDYLREAIDSGRLAPGQRLRDADLASELEVSRTPVREALRRLEDEGLVETWANRWTRVAPLDLGEAARLYPLIGAIERLAVLEAGEYSDDRLAALKDTNVRLDTAVRDHDPVSATRADDEFHQLLVAGWENPDAIRILDDLKRRLQRYFDGSLLAEHSIGEHRAVLDALLGGDRRSAAEAIEENWRNSLERFRQQIADQRDREPPGL